MGEVGPVETGDADGKKTPCDRPIVDHPSLFGIALRTAFAILGRFGFMLPFGISQAIALSLRLQNVTAARRTRSWNWPRFRPGPSTKGDGFTL